MKTIASATALPGFRLLQSFTDGVSGEVDHSDLAGRGVFQDWLEPEVFGNVQIRDGRSLVWNDRVDMCADALYLQITGLQPHQLFPRLAELTHA